MTQLEYAKKNIVTPLMKRIAQDEGLNIKQILRRISEGKVVIPRNFKHNIKNPCGIGLGLRTKVNANIGTSTDKSQIKDELDKLYIALRYGADTVMDLSVGGNLKKIRKEIIRNSPIPIGTVPIYEIAVNASRKKGNFLKFTIDDILDTLQLQAEEGIDFFTIHAGVTQKSLNTIKKNKRIYYFLKF